MGKVYCPFCGNEGYEVVDGIPQCKKCGRAFYVDEYQQQKNEEAREELRKKFNLVSYEDVLKLPKKYGMSREQINIVLDLDNFDGAYGISVWKGEVPSKSESERIRKALNDKEYFLERLEAVKDRIPEEKYRKVRKRLGK